MNWAPATWFLAIGRVLSRHCITRGK
jgi:hypothetical protein